MNFLQILQKIAESGADFLIVGGVAARLYGSTRLTHDIDIVPSLEAKAWKKLIRTLYELGARPRIPEHRKTIEDVENVRTWVKAKSMISLSFRTKSGEAEVDLLVGESDRFEALKKRANKVLFKGVCYQVASLEDLIAMKRKSGRPQDLIDIETLERLKKN